jgi:hypothetical protein
MPLKKGNEAPKTLKVSSSISKKEAKQIAESKQRAVHRFDAHGNCKMPLRELLERHVHFHSVYAMLYEREWHEGRGREPESAISGVVMDADIEGGKPYMRTLRRNFWHHWCGVCWLLATAAAVAGMTGEGLKFSKRR